MRIQPTTHIVISPSSSPRPSASDAFDVVRFHAVEELGALYRHETVRPRDAERGLVDIDRRVGTGAFRLATARRWRPVLGLITEATLVDQADTQIPLRVVLEDRTRVRW